MNNPWRKKKSAESLQRGEQVWLPNGPTLHTVSELVGTGESAALSLNPWLVPGQLLAAYVAAAAGDLPPLVSKLDAARFAQAPFNTWSGEDSWPEGIAGSSHEYAPGCFMGVDAYRQHVALLLQVTGWDVERLVSAASMSSGGAALFAVAPVNESTTTKEK